MNKSNFESFMKNVLDITYIFAKKNNLAITFGLENQKSINFKMGESPLKEGLRYYISPLNNKSIYYLRFIENYNRKFAVVIDNRSISLTLDENLQRLTTYSSNDFNKRIDNISGDFSEKLSKYLYMMWDFSYALQILYAN